MPKSVVAAEMTTLFKNCLPKSQLPFESVVKMTSLKLLRVNSVGIGFAESEN